MEIYVNIKTARGQNNFKASRVITDSTTNQDATLEVVRYSSPETLEKKSKYDTRCEVYSFGILLWEIAEEKIPFLMRLVCNERYREPFSLGSPLPKEYQELAKLAVQHDQNLRPQFSKIFTRLQELYKKDGGYSPLHSPNLTPINNETLANDINFNEYRLMSVDEAIKQHKLSNGNCELAYKCFEANAKLNDMKAKYFKAYYIQQSLVKLDMDQAIKDKLVADLYKEVADFGDSEAQLRYSNCLLKGIGVKKDLQAAAEYYTKAAENGQVIVIHDDNAKITDFGISKHMNAQNTTIHIGIFGRIPYVDPNKLNDLKFQYEKVSDIYSFGVLMWEISSGVLPFKDFISISDQELLIIKIINGYRENDLEETPDDYKELYKKCWDSVLMNRPSIKEVLEKFRKVGLGIDDSTYENPNSKETEINIKSISTEEIQTVELYNIDTCSDLSCTSYFK
ncbi:11926_t:CDS:2 [Funneliformis geosporum]|nr:11926_t:CDS:2 [Funneliformis geosporum]